MISSYPVTPLKHEPLGRGRERSPSSGSICLSGCTHCRNGCSAPRFPGWTAMPTSQISGAEGGPLPTLLEWAVLRPRGAGARPLPCGRSGDPVRLPRRFQQDWADWARQRAGRAVHDPCDAPSERCGGWPVDCLMADGPYAGRLVCILGPWGMSTGTQVSAIVGCQNSLAGGFGADR